MPGKAAIPKDEALSSLTRGLPCVLFFAAAGRLANRGAFRPVLRRLPARKMRGPFRKGFGPCAAGQGGGRNGMPFPFGMAAARVLLRESWAGSRDRGKGNNCRTGGSARFPLRRPFRFVPGSPAASQQGARVPAMRERLSGVPPEGVPGLKGACGGEARFEDGIPLRTFPGWRSLGVFSVNRNCYFFRGFRIGRRERQ